MFLKNIIEKRRWRYPINLFGFLILMGTVANLSPWTRGWFNDLRWLAGHIVKMKQQGFPLADFSAYLENVSLDENSPKGIELKKKFDAWYSTIIKRYPDFRVDYKIVPDDQNGFLKIIEWQDGINVGKSDPNYVELRLPSQFQDALDFGSEDIPPDTLIEIESYLKTQQKSMDRAMAIGLMPEQSCSGISSNQRFLLVSFAKEIVDHLTLKALLEVSHGDANAAFNTTQALRGWGNHYAHIETPTLIDSTLGTAIELKMRGMVYRNILPRLSDENLDYAQWADLFKDKLNIEQHWFHMFRGEWHSVIHNVLPKSPGAPIPLLDTITTDWHYRAGTKGLYDTEEAIKKKSTSLGHISVGSRGLHKALFYGISAYRPGYIKTQATLQQYEVAFTLRKLEAEGQNLDALDSKIIGMLPLIVTPDIHLSIDFDKRLISVSDPKKLASNVEDLEF